MVVTEIIQLRKPSIYSLALYGEISMLISIYRGLTYMCMRMIWQEEELMILELGVEGSLSQNP